MREYSTPLSTEIPATGNLTDDVVANAREHADAVVFSRHVGGVWTDVTAARVPRPRCRAVAKGLMAAGIEAGRPGRADLASTRYEWTLVDYAIWFAGCRHGAGLRDVVGRADRLDPAGLRAPAPWWPRGPATSPGSRRCAAELDELRPRLVARRQRGRRADPARAATSPTTSSRRAVRTATPLDLATLIYTSGTTGRPKGCMLTHGNFMFELGVAVEELDELFDEGASTLLFLPLAHVFARIIQVGCVKRRVRLGHSADITHLVDRPGRVPADVRAGRPPRLREGLQHRLAAGDRRRARRDLRPRRRDRDRLVPRLRTAARSRSRSGRSTPCSPGSSTASCSPRSAAGARYAISGGAPLGDRLGHFYRGIGLTVLEGYGLTETTAALTVNLPDAHKVGTVGRPLPGTAVRVAEDGELLFRGGQVFAGYWGNEDRHRARRSSATAGSTPATSARSTTRASCGSPAARRRSW